MPAVLAGCEIDCLPKSPTPGKPLVIQDVDLAPPKEEKPKGLMRRVFGGKKKDGAQGDEVVTLPQVPETMRRVGASPSERERIETEIIKSLISSYFDIVRKNWMDLVPKACMHFMVKHAKENMQNELVSKLYKEDLLSEVMRETPEVAQRRQAHRHALQRLLPHHRPPCGCAWRRSHGAP